MSVERLVDFEGERLMISNLLSRQEFCRSVLPQLSVDLFEVDIHRRVLELLQDAHEHGCEPGLTGAYRRLLDRKTTPEELGLPVLSELAWNNTVDLPNAAPWLKSLREKSVERDAWRAGEKFVKAIESGEDPSQELAGMREYLRGLESQLAETERSYATITDMVERMEGGIGSLFTPGADAVGTPFESLTRITNGGPRPGQFWIIAARPSVGKTTFGLQLAAHVAGQDKPVLFVSLEMCESELLKRLISSAGGIDHGSLVRGDLTQTQRRAVTETIDRIGHMPLTISDRIRGINALLAEVAKGASGRAPWSLVVVDYLGLLETNGRHETRNLEGSAISRSLKLLALDEKLPVIALHQLNRGNENERRRPQLSDLRDSGSLEQDADVVLMLDSPAARGVQDIAREAADILIGKQRNGARGISVPLRFDFAHCRLI
jgi:replicative DNA helicase